MEVGLRAAFVGTDRGRSLQEILVAAGLSAVVLVVPFLPLDAGAVVEPGLVVVGFGLASWWAYDNSGLAVGVALVSVPVVARLTYYSLLSLGQPAPAALPLSFGGHGAWEMWVPLALFPGVVAFVAGTILRWGRRFAVESARWVT